MTIQALKAKIADLPDDMPVKVFSDHMDMSDSASFEVEYLHSTSAKKDYIDTFVIRAEN